jgi:hypothetical protein
VEKEEEEETVGNKFKRKKFLVGWLMGGLFYDALVQQTTHSIKCYNYR